MAALPPPATLPNLPAALSRRAALFGGMALASLPKPARAASADDALMALGAEVDRTLDGAVYALAPVHDEVDQNQRLDYAEALLFRMSLIPARSGRGLLAKAKAYLDSESYDVQNLHDIAESLANDIERLHKVGGLV